MSEIKKELPADNNKEHEHPEGIFFKDSIYFFAKVKIPARYAEGLSQTQFFALSNKEAAIKTWVIHLINATIAGVGVKLEEET